uniref:Lactate/malate dehydrogenase C-terminal domain-containing protein n=1 Tax=Suricata suricatta TaxID=37032 RepID=A0A673U5S8_SURSU
MTTLKEKLIVSVSEEEATVPNNKITVAGVGKVGLACAISILGKSTMVKGMYGIENEIFLSLPCILKAQGLTNVINQKLKVDEVTRLKKSADTLWHIEKDLKDL